MMVYRRFCDIGNFNEVVWPSGRGVRGIAEYRGTHSSSAGIGPRTYPYEVGYLVSGGGVVHVCECPSRIKSLYRQLVSEKNRFLKNKKNKLAALTAEISDFLALEVRQI